MGTEGTQSSVWDQHVGAGFAAKRPEQALATIQNGAEVILELLRTNGTDCIFASPIATMAPLWEALAARRERGEPEAPRYFHCRHEMLAVSAASGYYKATGRAQAVFLPTGFGVLHGAMALRTALQERTPMTVLSPDTLSYGETHQLDPGPGDCVPRPDPDLILKGSPPGLLERFADSYAILADLRNCRGVTPTRRLKWREDWL